MSTNDSEDQAQEPATEGPFAKVSRRGLFKKALAAIIGVPVVVGGVAVGTMLTLRGCAPGVEGLEMLSGHGYRTLVNLARTHLPRGGPFEPGADDFDLARVFDGFLAGEPQKNIDDLQNALMLFEFGPVLFEGTMTTFSNLEPDAQLAHWQGWSTSEELMRRQVALAFRKFLNTVFYDQPEVWPHIGYPGPMVG